MTRFNFILLLISLFTTSRLDSQKLTPSILEERISEFFRLSPWEEIYLHTDRDKYIAGEDLWFSLYTVDRETGLLSGRSSLAYIELLNPWNTPLLRTRIHIPGGRGEGYFLLPDTISSGTYTIRAYTNRMKNFLPENSFTQDIEIYNPFNTSGFTGKVELTGDTLPGAINNGFSAAVDYSFDDRIEITITADGSRVLPSSQYYLFVIQTNGNTDYINSLTIKDIITKISVPVSRLSGGISHIALISDDGEVIFERLIYSPWRNRSTLRITADSIYGRREKVSIWLAVSNNDESQPGISEMSVSVTPDFTAVHNGITDYLAFGTESGRIPWTTGSYSLPLIDQNLTNDFPGRSGSSRMKWQDIISGKIPPEVYRFESEGHYLSVTVKHRGNLTTDSADFLYMSVKGKVAEFKYASRDSSGKFTFILPVDHILRYLIIQPEHATSDMMLEIEPSFSWKLAESITRKKILTDSQLEAFSTLSFNYQASRIYGTKLRRETEAPSDNNPRKRRFYGIPEMEIHLDDYIRLPTMQEVFFELVPGVILRSNKTGFEIKIINPLTGVFYDEKPLVMVDGVIINDLAVLVDLDPETIEKIEVVKTPYLIGDLILQGIVNVITRSGDFSNITMPDYAVILPYRVADKPPVFEAPDYSDVLSRTSRTPDLRNTLYWNPSVKTDDKGAAGIEFWTSDLPGFYTINIQGITGTGEMISLYKSFRVR
ncbi:MAG: hypothetical protein IQL11_10660 [Bacteroidales bacterium]|nr:hypothetical protein [Bacteroidales bacterium]